ncbi:hypothetical protein HNQ91_004151 [Filimonas zeae]|uniref:Nitrogen fixation protein FixH n=1 Tax=Filimonas zeae TaxID=1737353 RepID=A0A917J2S7_9BACT|nr:FixH family protein [Filimonas zeae]MDR6341078.1 hypothetical protein [Filimonas zeae]GGH77316.1 hypothetical protein GCM10011379_43480 [Filimonas zeae]
MSWGRKLMIVFGLFALLMGTLVYKAMHTRFDLVSADYYKQELRYQQRIDGIANAARLGAPAVEQNTTTLTITMPQALKGMPVKGEAWFYRKSDAAADTRIALELNEDGQQVISKKLLMAGPYQLKLDWKAGETVYYVEKELLVN